MKYQIAEKFKSIQGEGVYTGTPMAFIRFVGCSVGKKICQHCDTDFERMLPWQGGGEFTAEELHAWARPYEHICLTGGEPFDQDLRPLMSYELNAPKIHIETSGTKEYPFGQSYPDVWICVSPKPGFIETEVLAADEIKVIVPGLGSNESLTALYQKNSRASPMFLPLAERDTFRWPTIEDALRWADMGKIVFLQPRNGKVDIDYNRLRLVQDIIIEHPQLRLSTQLHKVLKVQ
jgi:organic radical activating enzyme